MYDTLAPILWATVTFFIMWLMQLWIHRHLQGVSYLLMGSPNGAVLVYALVLFPGVLLHELSHWLMAKVLGVRTGKLSLIPSLEKDGTVRLGYVEYYKTADLGALRESLIGGAPLILGTTAVLAIATYIFGLPTLAQTLQPDSVDSVSLAFADLLATDDFWLWFYLLFAISNAMLPSASDRRAWPAFLAWVMGGGVVLYLLDFQAAVWAGVAGPLATVFGYLQIAFSLTIGVNLFFMALIGLLEWVVGGVSGRAIRYGE